MEWTSEDRDGSILRCSLELTVLVLVWIAALNLGNELVDTTIEDGSIRRRSLEAIVLVLVPIAGLNPGN